MKAQRNQKPKDRNQPSKPNHSDNKKKQFSQKQKKRPEEPEKKIHYVVHPNRLKHLLKLSEHQDKKKAVQQQKEAKEQKFKQFKKNKIQRNKVLTQKTRRGQPVMKGRIEMLLKKIQANE